MFACSILIGTMLVSCCAAVFERWLGLLSSPCSPIIGTWQSLHCVERHSDKDSSTCTHTSTSAAFHLRHRTQAGEAKTPIPNHLLLCRHCLNLSAVFNAHTKCRHMLLYTKMYAHTVHHRGFLASLWWTNAEAGATPLSKEIPFPLLFRKLLGSQGWEKVLAFCYFWRISVFVGAKWDLGQRRQWFPSFMYPLLTETEQTGRQQGNNQSPFFSTFFLAHICAG